MTRRNPNSNNNQSYNPFGLTAPFGDANNVTAVPTQPPPKSPSHDPELDQDDNDNDDNVVAFIDCERWGCDEEKLKRCVPIFHDKWIVLCLLAKRILQSVWLSNACWTH
ncbi:hypothetical protein ACA910_008284 [Epithemia clementina (nom. ined.)]